MVKTERIGGILVKCEDEVLLCKRGPDGSLPGVWSIPSGHIHPKENAKIGAIREFKEETNLKSQSDINLMGMITRYTRDGLRVKGLMYVFLMEVDKKMNPELDKAKDGGEHTECGYFNINDLPLHNSDQLGKLVKTLLNK